MRLSFCILFRKYTKKPIVEWLCKQWFKCGALLGIKGWKQRVRVKAGLGGWGEQWGRNHTFVVP